MSLRDIGYDFPAAVADIVDNSIAAAAAQVDVHIEFDGPKSYVLIADDGAGMSDGQLTEALRFGSRREYELGELGRYGLGLKTASISQCRRLTVVSRRTRSQRRLVAHTLDVDHIASEDRWEIIPPPVDSVSFRALEWLNDGPGTVVIWELLDRILPDRRPEGGWAKRRMEHLAVRTRDYLGMVFHRFLEGDVGADPIVITVNGEKVQPWNPFAPDEAECRALPVQRFEINVGDMHGTVTFRPFVLPSRHAFSSTEEFERLGGPSRWNRQQGLYVYRAGRMIQGGGWSGVRAVDEHTKLARAALEFGTELDDLFQINVSKMRVVLPQEIRSLIERPIHELCHEADSVYRNESQSAADAATPSGGPALPAGRLGTETGTAILSAALEVGEHAALERVILHLREREPDVADALGW